jgi:hypothetical protein
MAFRSIALTTSTLVLSTSINAALIDNGSYTTDSLSGYDWLDLTETTKISFGDLLLQLDTGGALYAEGWQLASWSDVTTLFDNAGGDGTYNDGGADPLLGSALLPLWGITQPPAYGWFATQDVTPGGNTTGGILDINGETWYLPDAFSTPDTEYDFVGAALYRPMVVPIPAAVWLFGSGLIGLIGISRRK